MKSMMRALFVCLSVSSSFASCGDFEFSARPVMKYVEVTAYPVPEGVSPNDRCNDTLTHFTGVYPVVDGGIDMSVHYHVFDGYSDGVFGHGWFVSVDEFRDVIDGDGYLTFHVDYGDNTYPLNYYLKFKGCSEEDIEDYDDIQ